MSRNLRLLLAGAQAGMAGALLLLCWVAVGSLMAKHSAWWVPNLFSSLFFGDVAMREGFSRFTWTGIALVLVQYTALGSLFAFAFRQDADRLRAVLLGIVTSIGWYYLTFHWVWKAVSPLMLLYTPDAMRGRVGAVYTPDRPILAGHVLYGLWLGRTPVYARRLER